MRQRPLVLSLWNSWIMIRKFSAFVPFYLVLFALAVPPEHGHGALRWGHLTPGGEDEGHHRQSSCLPGPKSLWAVLRLEAKEILWPRKNHLCEGSAPDLPVKRHLTSYDLPVKRHRTHGLWRLSWDWVSGQALEGGSQQKMWRRKRLWKGAPSQWKNWEENCFGCDSLKRYFEKKRLSRGVLSLKKMRKKGFGGGLSKKNIWEKKRLWSKVWRELCQQKECGEEKGFKKSLSAQSEPAIFRLFSLTRNRW